MTPASRGSLNGKRATFIIAAGGLYSKDAAHASRNYLVPWLRTVFNDLGVTDVRFLMVEGTRATNGGSVDRETFLAPHRQAVRSVVA